MDVFGTMEVDEEGTDFNPGPVWNLPRWETSKDDVPAQRTKSSIGTDIKHAIKQDNLSHIPFNFRGNLQHSKYNSRYHLEPTRADSVSSASSPPSFMPSGRSSLSSVSTLVTPPNTSYRSSFSLPQKAESQTWDLHGITADFDQQLDQLIGDLRQKMKLRHRFHTWEECGPSNSQRPSSKLSLVRSVGDVEIETAEICQHCWTQDRQMWQHNKSLCNPCGMFLQLHGVPRPLSHNVEFMKKQSTDYFMASSGDGPGSFKTESILSVPDFAKSSLKFPQYDRKRYSGFFSPLRIERKETRLVILQGGEPQDELCATLITVSLFERQRYDVLSHTCDTDAETQPMIFCGAKFVVGKNLNAALRRMRLIHRTRTLWIDTLCINQDDAMERQYQVSLMIQIYQNSLKILIWLEEGPGFKQPATEYTSDLGDVSIYGLQNQSATTILDNDSVSEMAIVTISERAKEMVSFGFEPSEPLPTCPNAAFVQETLLASHETDWSPRISISQSDTSFSEGSSVNSLEDAYADGSTDGEDQDENEPVQIFEEGTDSLLLTLKPILAPLPNNIALRLAHELRMLFDTWFESIPGPKHESQPNDTISGSQTADRQQQKQVTMSPPANRQKRRLKDIGGGSPEDGDDETDETRKYPRLGPKIPTGNSGQRWACPYYQREPHRYCVETEQGDFRKCARSPGFREVHRVKDHIYHCHAAVYCERCYSIFRKDEDLKAHRRDPAGCQVQEPRPVDGLTDEQKQMLKPRDRNKSEEERWNAIYKICFPDDQVIPSPYYVYYSRETAGLRREVFAIVEEETRRTGNVILRGRILQRLQIAFDHAQTANLRVQNGPPSELLTPSASSSTSLRSSLQSSVPSTQNSLGWSVPANRSIQNNAAPPISAPGSTIPGASSSLDNGRLGVAQDRFPWGNGFLDDSEPEADLFAFDPLVEYDDGRDFHANSNTFDDFFLRS